MTKEELIKNLEEYDKEVNKLFQENKKLKKEPYELKRHIKKLNRRIKYLENEITNKKDYIKELEEIEDNKLILLFRNIKEEEILDFDYSCGRSKNGKEFEDALDYNIHLKRKYKGEENDR